MRMGDALRWVPALGAACALSQVFVASSGAAWVTTPDPSFGHDGSVVTQVVPGVANAATSVALQRNGDLLVGGSDGGGHNAAPGSSSGFLVRLLPEGRIDSSFGGIGMVKLPAPVTEVEEDLEGSAEILAFDGSLVDLNQDGSIDKSFGRNGTAVLPSGFVPQSFVIEWNGDIALIGSVAQPGGGSDVALTLLTATGQPNDSFGADGLAVLPTPLDPLGKPLTSVSPGGLVSQPGGGIVLTVLGYSPSYSVGESYLERVTAGGAPDTSFGSSGQTHIANGGMVGTYDPLQAANGNILVVATSADGSVPGLQIWTTSAAGQELSSSVGRGILDPVGAFLPLPDGGYVTLDEYLGGEAGHLTMSLWGSNYKFGEPEGFGVRGPEEQVPVVLPDGGSDPGSLIAVQPDGKLIMAGTAPSTGGQQALFVARLFGINPPAVVSLPRQRVHRGARTVTLRLRCSLAQICNGRAELYLQLRHGARLVVGSSAFTIAAGEDAAVTVRLTNSGRLRLERRAPTRVGLTLTLTDGSARSTTIVVPRVHQ
jgi:uncharacterized delta-60 repeat protein